MKIQKLIAGLGIPQDLKRQLIEHELEIVNIANNLQYYRPHTKLADEAAAKLEEYKADSK